MACPGWTLEQTFGLGHQFLTQLVCAPTLPAFHLAGSCQRAVGLVLQRIVNEFAQVLEHIAQRSRGTGTGLAMALLHLAL